MSLYLEERDDESFALYLDGDLQFDTRDEALYHESLTLPALSLARRARPNGMRVLICGGGDGLALRECLRFPGVAHADLVDYDPEVVALGRTRFDDLNAHAFDDPRAHVHIADAWEFLANAEPYDVVLCDFTVPRRPEDTRVFTQEWYARLVETLTPDGIIALNAVSPQRVPEAFWCLRKTVRAAGLSALPYRACIPSFRAQGYGAWGFLLASPRPLTGPMLHHALAACPVPTRQADLGRLWRGARFSRAERALEARVPVHTLANGCLLPLLLNPGLPQGEEEAVEHPYDLNPLLRAIPILHPYHTRLMVETLATQVIGTVSALDLRRLVDAVLRRAAALPHEVRAELTRLREFLSLSPRQMQVFGAWCGRLFAALVLLMTLANAIAPDNAFAKGSFGGAHGSAASVGHSSFGGGRGFSSGSSRSSGGSFSGSRGFSESSRGGGSFGRGAGSGLGGSRSLGSSQSFGSNSVFSGRSGAPHFTGSGFRSSYGRGHAVSMEGVSYSSREFFYCGSGMGHVHSYTLVHGGTAPAMAPQAHESLFVAAKDMLVLDNGDVVVTLSDTAYLLVTNGTVALMSNKNPDPLMLLYPDPGLFENIRAQLAEQGNGVEQAITARQDWISWVGWTSALLTTVGEDRKELTNLQDLDRRLHTAYDRLGDAPAGTTATAPATAENVELFIGCQLRTDGTIAIRDDKGAWLITDGVTFTLGQQTAPRPAPPLLTAALHSVLVKLDTDSTAALQQEKHDLDVLRTDLQSLQNDLLEYQSLQRMNDSDYEVDYGTDQIPASEAIRRTQNDIDQNARDTQSTEAEVTRLNLLQTRLADLVPRYKAGR
jgi:spermidine synthase